MEELEIKARLFDINNEIQKLQQEGQKLVMELQKGEVKDE